MALLHLLFFEVVLFAVSVIYSTLIALNHVVFKNNSYQLLICHM